MKKILVIGSGPIIIGQAAEFDYAGTQACKSLREEGYSVVLINSNPATIMTDAEMADAVYIEPLTVDFCERVIARERPEGLLPTLGGQTGLNLASQLADQGILEKYGVKMLGTPLEAIRKAEDRELFRTLMHEIQEPVPESWIVETDEQLKAALDEVPYPCIVRPAYTLGGTGGGVAYTPDELWEIGRKGLKLSMRSQLMIERSLLGWKEIEYEVMRDKAGNCITVCNMENFDPMGVHTGDSIVIAPSQTLSDIEYHMMRTASLKIINALGIEGGCNVQMALNPDSFDYYIIEVNPRVSRSSALASKATGYPIARVAAKIAVGRTLDEIENMVTRTTKACFEPALDYCVVKIPRWPFDKFASGDRRLSSQMKATGEVMAIDRTFESAFMKAIRGLEVKQKDLRHPKFQGTGLGRDGQATHARDERATGEGGMGVPPMGSSAVSAESERRRGAYLPHMREGGAVYSVNFRLGDALPQEVWRAWKEQRERLLKEKQEGIRLSHADSLELIRLYSENVERYLDAGKGSCVLKDQRAAEIVADALAHFDGERYLLHAWCVMPNHVHVIVEPLGDHTLEGVLHSWKSSTAHEINKAVGRKGALWQPEYYDHILRTPEEYESQVAYVLENPGAAKLKDWQWVGTGLGRDGEATHARDERATGASEGGMGSRDERAIGPMPDDELEQAVAKPTDERLWAIAEAIRRGWTLDRVYDLSRVDKWFLTKIETLIATERALTNIHVYARDPGKMREIVKEAFLLGFPSPTIESIIGITDELKQEMRQLREEAMAGMIGEDKELLQGVVAYFEHGQDEDAEASLTKLVEGGAALLEKPTAKAFWDKYSVSDDEFLARFYCVGAISRQKIQPVFKMVDTCAGEFESATPYYYGTFETEDDAVGSGA